MKPFALDQLAGTIGLRDEFHDYIFANVMIRKVEENFQYHGYFVIRQHVKERQGKMKSSGWAILDPDASSLPFSRTSIMRALHRRTRKEKPTWLPNFQERATFENEMDSRFPKSQIVATAPSRSATKGQAH